MAGKAISGAASRLTICSSGWRKRLSGAGSSVLDAKSTPEGAGGQGAVRECCDLLLVASGHYARLLDEAAQ